MFAGGISIAVMSVHHIMIQGVFFGNWTGRKGIDIRRDIPRGHTGKDIYPRVIVI